MEHLSSPPAADGDSAAAAVEITGQCSPSTARILAAKRRRNRRSYIVAVGHTEAAVARWLSRRRWLEDLSLWASHEGAEVLCRRVNPRMFMAVAEVLAQFADSADGRHCAATNRTAAKLAGCSERTVSTVRAILAASGFAVLARQGCGGGGRPHRVAVWHLVSRRTPVDKRTVCDLPPSRRDRGLSHPGRNKPTARTRAGRSPSQKTRRTRRGRPPRPVALQWLAADLVRRTHGLANVHIGAICDVLTAAGIDPAHTSAEQICHLLEADMRATGWSWPDEIERPAAFLAYRLNRITGRLKPSPPVEVGVTADRIDDEPQRVSAGLSREVQWPEGSCAVCGAEEAPRRPWLPPRRAHVCDPCWAVAGDCGETPAQVVGAGL